MQLKLQGSLTNTFNVEFFCNTSTYHLSDVHTNSSKEKVWSLQLVANDGNTSGQLQHATSTVTGSIEYSPVLRGDSFELEMEYLAGGECKVDVRNTSSEGLPAPAMSTFNPESQAVINRIKVPTGSSHVRDSPSHN